MKKLPNHSYESSQILCNLFKCKMGKAKRKPTNLESQIAKLQQKRVNAKSSSSNSQEQKEVVKRIKFFFFFFSHLLCSFEEAIISCERATTIWGMCIVKYTFRRHKKKGSRIKFSSMSGRVSAFAFSFYNICSVVALLNMNFFFVIEEWRRSFLFLGLTQNITPKDNEILCK